MFSKANSLTLSPTVQTAESATAHPLTATSDTNTRAESRRTEDEAVTLPIPSSGLLTSPTQVGGQSVLPSWFGGVSSTAESHFSLAPLLGRSAPGCAMSPSKRAAVTSTDGAVRMSGSPRPWPTPPHAIREFGHMPSRVCSSGGTQTPSRRRSSGNLTLGGMMAAATAVEEEHEEQLADPACSECSNTPWERGPDQEAPDAGSGGDEAAPDFQVHALDSGIALAVAAIENDACDETYCGAVDGEANINYDGDVAAPLPATDEEVQPGESSPVMPADSSLLGDVSASAGGAEQVSNGATGAVCGDFVPSDAEEVDGPQWLTAEECAVSDAITQLQAVVSGLSEPYQRYIRERALELTRIIDENLQRQGLEPVASGGSGPGTSGGMATPSKKAATAAAALVLAVAASGTQWPYSAQNAGDSGDAGGDFAKHAERDDDAVDDTGGDSCAPDDARWLFRSPEQGRAGGIDLVGGGPLAGAPTQALSYGAAAASGSCTLCFGSVLGNSQVRGADSVEQTSGAVSARGPTSSFQGPANNRPTPRSRSYSSYYAQQQSQRRLAGMRSNGGQPPSASAISSACSNPYPQDLPQQPSAGRRVPPRPPPRGLGCGLGHPRKMASEGSGPRPDPCVDAHNLPYLMAPCVLEPATAREPLQRPSSARPRFSAHQQLDQQQPHDQDDFTGPLDEDQQQQIQIHDAAGNHQAVGRDRPATGSTGNAAILRAGNGSSGGGGRGQSKNAAIAHRGGIRPAAPTPAGYQPPWQRPPPAGRSASEKHRADPAGQQDVKNRKGVMRVMSARGEPGMPSKPAAHRRGAAASGGGSARRPLPSARTVTSECDDDLSAVTSAREATCSEAGSCYQQLLRKSARSSLASINRRGTVGAAPPSGGLLPSSHRPSARLNSYPIATSSEFHSNQPGDGFGGGTMARATTDPGDTPGTHEVCSAGGGHQAAAGTTWNDILPSELPYHLVQAFPAVGSATDAVSGAAVRLDWQPLHTALTLDELTALAGQPVDSSDAGARGAQQHSRALGAAPNGGVESAPGRTYTAFATANFTAAPFAVDDHEEPATAFAIISRRGTRDVVDDLAPQSSAAGTSSLGDLSSLLPAPAWRQGRNGTAPETSSAGGVRGGAGAAAAGNFGGGQRGPSELGNSIISGCSTQVWDNGNNVPDQLSRVRDGSVSGGFGIGVPMSRDPTFGGAAEQPDERSGGGSAAAQLRSVLASMGGAQAGAAGSGQGRRWQLDADRLVVPDKEQIRAGSPVRPRYAGNSDSHMSPAAPEPQPPVVRRRDASSAREGRPAKGSGRGTSGTAGAGAAKGPKGSNAKRSNGTLGATGRASGGGRSRSTPHARAAKAIRAARGHGSSSRPPAPLPPGPAPAPPVLLPQRPGTPVAPSSPPPPQQSQTPVQLQQQQQGPVNPGARRWTDDDDDDDDEGVRHHSQESTGASGDESDSTPSTPTRRRLHVHSPEDMPLSAAARNSAQPRLGVADVTTRSAFDAVSGAVAAAAAAAGLPPPSQPGVGLGLGLATVPALATAATMPVAAPGWGTYTSSPQAFRLRQNPSGGLSPRLRGVAYAPLPSHRWAAGRTYTTTSIHTDGTTTTVVTSPGLNRAAWHHDCTPNILSPPRNYDRPWATPSRKNSAQVEGGGGAGEMESAGYARSARLNSPRGSGRRGTGQGDDGSVLGSPTSGRRGSMTARPAFGRSSPRQGNDRPRNKDVARSGAKETEGAKAGEDCGLSAVGGPLGPIGTVAEEEKGRPNVAPRGPLTSKTAPLPGFPAPGVAVAAALGVADAARNGQAHASTAVTDLTGKTGSAAVDAHPHMHAGSSAPGAAAAAGTASVAAVAVSSEPALRTAAVDIAAASVNVPGAQRGGGVASGAVRVLQASAAAPDMKAEGVQTDALEPIADSTFNTLNLSQTARRSSDGSRSRGSPSGPMTARTDGGRGYGGRSGRPPIGAFRPSGSLRAAPAGTGGAQLALLHQAAWPGLRDPRVVDILSTLEAGIAVLDPAPPPPPSSLGTHDPSEGGPGSGASAPNGCFGLFNRHAAAAAHKAHLVPMQVPAVAPQRPVLMRVHVADGAVELALLRPRRANGNVGGAAAPAPGEQRVRVAALSGVHPPLGNAASAGAGGVPGAAACLDDDVADPSSRWVQLVAMDGGLMRLSACSPADHARLVLGLNAGLLAAMGAIDEGALLSTVPLCRGLGGLP